MSPIASSVFEVSVPGELVVRRRVARRLRIAMASVLVAVSGTVSTSLVYTVNADREVGNRYELSLAVYNDAAAQIRRAAELEARQKQTADQVIAAANLKVQPLRSVALAELANALPPGVALTNLSIEPGADGGVITTVAGTATCDSNVTQFIERLGRSGTFRQVACGDGTPAGQFQITANFSSDGVDEPVASTASQQPAQTVSTSN